MSDPTRPSSTPMASRFLEQVLLANFVIHLVALVTMAAVCMPGVPDATAADPAARLAYVADHAVLWRVAAGFPGTFRRPSICLPASPSSAPAGPASPPCSRCSSPSRRLAWSNRAKSRGPCKDRSWPPRRATRATFSTIWNLKLPYNDRHCRLGGASLYMIMALGWTWCFAAAGTWSSHSNLAVRRDMGRPARRQHRSAPAQTLAAAARVDRRRQRRRLPPAAALAGPCDRARCLRRSRPDEAHGRMAPWRHPWAGPVGRAIDMISNSRFVRGLCAWLPLVGLTSDITDVIYANYLVDAERLLPLVPRVAGIAAPRGRAAGSRFSRR